MTRLMDREPVLLTSMAAAIVSVAVAFGAPVTADQREAVLELVAVIVAIYTGQAWVARSRVYAPATVARMESRNGVGGAVVGSVGSVRGAGEDGAGTAGVVAGGTGSEDRGESLAGSEVGDGPA